MADIIGRHPGIDRAVVAVDDPMISARVQDMPGSPKRLTQKGTRLLAAGLAGTMAAAVVMRLGRPIRPIPTTPALGIARAAGSVSAADGADETLRARGHGALLPYQLAPD